MSRATDLLSYPSGAVKQVARPVWFTGYGRKSGRTTYQAPWLDWANSSALQTVALCEASLEPSSTYLTILGELDVHLGSLSHWRGYTPHCREGGALWVALCQPGGGQCVQTVVIHLILLKWSSSLSEVQQVLQPQHCLRRIS